MKRILVIDGQGGRLGALVIEELKKKNVRAEIVAVGTNAAATTAMLKSGSDAGATGEYPVVYHAARSSVIIGPIGILAAGSLCGEITPEMATAVGLSDSTKILIPSERCTLHVMGTAKKTMTEYAAEAAVAAIGALEAPEE